MSKAFKGAAHAAHSLVESARRSGHPGAVQQAKVIATLVQGLARLERGFASEGQQLSAALSRLHKSLRSPSAPVRKGGELAGYYVSISPNSERSRGHGFRASDTGLVGRRVGRGPVQMSPAAHQSTKAATAAFAKLLSAQTHLRQLRDDLERMKARR